MKKWHIKKVLFNGKIMSLLEYDDYTNAETNYNKLDKKVDENEAIGRIKLCSPTKTTVKHCFFK
jgi:hypothetical protein